tara:strand:- start:954 stop:1757 length:804 start_codon:yes stop_codon:yes gene_type:complete
MAKKDAIFDYSSHFDVTPYLTECNATITNNSSNWQTDRVDNMWYGAPTETAPTPPSGWDVGTFKALHLYDMDFESNYKELDPTPIHKLVRDIKEAFNLPNKLGTHADGELVAWGNEYTCHADESNFLHLTAKECTAFPMVMNPMAFNDPKQSGDTKKCELLIGLQGGENNGLASHNLKMKVRPTMTNQTTFNAHNKTLADASTAPASYTNQTLSGSEFTQAGSVVLINCTNQYQPISDFSVDSITLNIAWYSHTYAEIKALIDAAIA